MVLPEKVVKEFDAVYNTLVQANQRDHQIWFEHVFLSWQWGFMLILTISPWVLWYIFRKKESTNRLLCGAFFVMSTAMILDAFGTELGYWSYRYELIPFLPSFVPWDLCLLPVSFLILAQIKPDLSPFIKAAVYSTFSVFLGEPIFEWLGFYETKNWSNYFSFPIHFVIFLIGYAIVTSDKFTSLKSK